MTHTVDELVSSMADDALEFYQLREELSDIWEGKKDYKKASWKAKLLFGRWIASKEAEQRYNSQFQK
jgi:hypothetical protein